MQNVLIILIYLLYDKCIQGNKQQENENIKTNKNKRTSFIVVIEQDFFII